MSTLDVLRVFAIAESVHVAYPEEREVFTERLKLYPNGCYVLMDIAERVMGYAITHPWKYGLPPELNTLLHDLPIPATTYYIHDVAILPEARGCGNASQIVNAIVNQARSDKFANISLVAVNRSEPFWERHHFKARVDPNLESNLRTYDFGATFMVREVG